MDLSATCHRPRVLQLVISLRPGGTERLVVELARRSRDAISSAICCLEEAGAWGEALRAEGVPVTALHRRPGFRPSLGVGVARQASAHRADVIHCHQYSPFVYGCLSKVRYAGIRLIFTEHGRLADAPPSPKRAAANRVLARMPDRVFAVSEDLKRHLVSEAFRPSQVDVIYNGIDPGPRVTCEDRQRMRTALALPADAFVVCTIARLDPVKDLQTLMAAVSRAAGHVDGLVLLVVGDGPEREALERASIASDGGHVRFLGHRDDAREVLAASDAYANSSIFEGVSLTILEAMAAALPIVATAVGGTPEIVTRETGLLVPARDPDALAAALGELARAPVERRAALGAAGRERLERHFTLDRMVDDYVRIYRGES